MLGKKRKLIIISAISLASVAVLGLVLWLFFPVILRAISPTWYTQYALARTGRALSAEITEINDFFNFPDFSDSDVMQLTIDSSNIFANLDYGGFLSPGINLTKLNIGIDLLHDRSAKQASLDIHTGWGDTSFLLTLYTNVQQIALGINNSNSWAVNADSIGKELAGLGLPVDEELKLDLGFLFPDVADEDKWEDILITALDFFKSLKFNRIDSTDYFSDNDGTVMTTLIDGSAFENLLYNITYLYYGPSETGDEIRRSLSNINATDHELTLLINENHIIQAAHIAINANTESTVTLTAQLIGTENMLNHILLDIKIGSEYGYNFYSLESKGQHVPVNGSVTNTTIISGFTFGEVQISSEIEEDRSLSMTAQLGGAAFNARGVLNVDDDKIGINLNTCNIDVEIPQFGTVYLSGSFNFAFGKASHEIRDITADAHNIADFEIIELYPLLQIVWNIILQDGILLEVFGSQLYDIILTTLFGEQFASYITDMLDGGAEGILSILNSLLEGRADNVLGLLIDYFGDRLFDGLGDLFSGDFIDNITGQLGDILNDILEGGLLDNLGDLFGDLGDLFGDFLGGFFNETSGNSISDWLSGLFGSPQTDDSIDD